MRINNYKLITINLIAYILFILPISKLDLFKENYSTLSLDTRGYFYLLFLGIVIGLILYYETLKLNRRYSIVILISMIIGVIIPHHVPYNIQGNLHLLFAYSGSFLVSLISFINIYRFNSIRNVFIFGVFLTFLTILKYNMVTCISEIVLMSVIMFSNMCAYIKISRY